MNRDKIVLACDRHSNETVTLRKHVTKYKHIQKWIVEFLKKSERRGEKIARVDSICITKSINLQKFCIGVWVRCDVDIIELTGRGHFIYREVNDQGNHF